MCDKVTVKDILVDKYDEFKNAYWDKVPRNMREHIDETVNKALRCMHRHSVLTIPDDLRNYFYRDKTLLKELQDGVYNVINYWYNRNRKNNTAYSS